MKKFLPVILVVVGLLVFVAAIVFVKGKNANTNSSDEEEEEVVPEIALEKRPITSLTPSEDGHWLKLVVEKIEIAAATLDYELLYKLPDGRTQGVPGTIKLDGQVKIDRDLLLGSESSGKFRYDEGVTAGSLTLRFRNDKGKLMAKFSTEFNLISGNDKLASPDDKLTYTLNELTEDTYFLTMSTFGLPNGLSFKPKSGPYGIFSSNDTGLDGKVNGSDYSVWNGTQWLKLEDGKASDIGIFVSPS